LRRLLYRILSPTKERASFLGKPSFWHQMPRLMRHRRRRHRRRTGSLTIRDSGASSSSSVFKLPANFTPPMTELDRRVLALQDIQVSLDVTDPSVSSLLSEPLSTLANISNLP